MLPKNKPKKLKTIHSFFGKQGEPSSANVTSTNPISTPPAQQVEREPQIDSSPLERDPGLRRQICTYPVNERDNIRLEYILLGPYQPDLGKKNYPTHVDGDQPRRFCHDWCTKFPWLEYSVKEDKAYCFPCFLFDEIKSHKAFIVDGFKNWKRVGGDRCSFLGHVGKANSVHHLATQQWQNLRNPSTHIDKVVNKLPLEKVMENRLRLNSSIESVRFLGAQALAFRGNDESITSSNRGNFIELLTSFGRINPEVKRVLENAPLNAKYTSPMIQKEILNIFTNKIRGKIREEIGNNKFCILVDEAQDSSNKEQMGIVLRFVDCKGLVKERFFAIVNVADTKSQTLKDEICKVLFNYNFLVENLRGQGYDGASNMRGAWNGLQALFLQECPYAYYVHCFAHRLQLSLVGAAEEVRVVWRFFSLLNNIVNFIGGSTKRNTELRLIREEELEELLDAGLVETGKGANQTRSLNRPGNTRWGSHFRSVNSLIELFCSTKRLVEDIKDTGSNRKLCGEAEGIYLSMISFDFVFVLHLMNKVMGITDFLCQQFQKKSIDIVSALNHITTTKMMLQELRENNWDDFFKIVVSFCAKHNIDVPDMTAIHKVGTRRSCQQRDDITVEHYYRFDIYNCVIDKQVTELDDRFPEQSKELLILSASLDPRDDYKSFNRDDICSLAEKFYPRDFTPSELLALKLQLGFYAKDIHQRPELQNISNISDLCEKLVITRLAEDYHLIHRLVCLVLTLPVSTSTTERAFSALRIIKNRLRSKIEEEFLDDCMLIHIEREFLESIDNDSIIDEFATKNRRVQLKIP